MRGGVGLAGATVAVIGGSSGIGLACARLAAERGATVTIAARDSDRLARAAASIGHGARGVVADVGDDESVRSIFAGMPGLDHAVVVAGDAVSAPLAGTDPAVQRGIMSVRLWGAVHTCKHAAGRLGGQGSITLCSGAAVARPRPGRPVSVAAGAAVEALVRALALELAPVRVNAVAPGPTRTPMLDRFYAGAPADALEQLRRHLPAGRLGEAGDAAEAVCFLMENPHATGITVPVDGGYRVS